MGATCPRPVYFQPLNLGLCVTAPQRWILNGLARLLGPFRREILRVVTHWIDLRTCSATAPGPAMHILVNGRLCHRAVPLRELIPYLEWVVNDLVVRSNGNESGYCLIHAAVVARGPVGILICGDAGCGKSSLALALMQHRYRYLSDEIAIWDSHRARVLAYPKAITLKEGGRRCFKRKRVALPTKLWHTKSFKGKVWYIDPEALSPGLTGRSARIRLIIFPVFREGATLQMLRLTKAGAIALLQAQQFRGNGFGPKDFDRLASLVKGTSAYNLLYGDLFEAAAAIDRVARQQG